MIKKQQKELFSDYFERWITVYKEGAIRKDFTWIISILLNYSPRK